MRATSIKIGDVYCSRSGELYAIMDYKGSKGGVTVQFLATGNQLVCDAKEAKNGSLKNPLYKSVYEAGCFGIGPFKAKQGGKFTPEYQLWIGMMTRIYHEPTLVDHPTYREVKICDEWLNFQNFAYWCQDQKGFCSTGVNGKRFALDKDLLLPNNKEYRPDACCFLPNHINVALKGRQIAKSEEIPSGVYWHNASNGYIASANKNGQQFHLGCFDNVEDATKVFRKFKTSYLQELAEEYKLTISEQAYQALRNIDLEARTTYNTAKV